jgi:hypothetical protein
VALSRVKTWIAGEVLTASDLNSEFNNILNNGVDLWSPASKDIDINGNKIILDADADSSITADTDDQIDFELAGFDVLSLKTVASAVNTLTYTAAATTTDLAIAASGSDSNSSIDRQTTGTGELKVNGYPVHTYSSLRRILNKAEQAFVLAKMTDARTFSIQTDGNRIIADRVFS